MPPVELLHQQGVSFEEIQSKGVGESVKLRKHEAEKQTLQLLRGSAETLTYLKSVKLPKYIAWFHASPPAI